MIMKQTTNQTVTIDSQIELTGKDIVEILSSKGFLPKLTKDYRVYINVPTGGDYSGMELEIDEMTPLIITYTEANKSKLL